MVLRGQRNAAAFLGHTGVCAATEGRRCKSSASSTGGRHAHRFATEPTQREMPQPVDIITVPWDSGRRAWRMGAGPAAILESGLARTLSEWGHDVRVGAAEPQEHGAIELLAATMELLATASQHVRRARRDGRFPLILAGNCIATLGAVAALDGADVVVLWLDAHGDLNTPATSASGFLDGMAAATLLGWCHEEASARIDGFRPLPVQRFVLVGARDLDPGEVEATRRHGVRVLSPEDAASESTLATALDAACRSADGVWLHVDLDVLDPAPLAPANAFTPAGGLSLYHAIRVVQEGAARGPVLGMTVSAYDPSCDPDGLLRAAVPPLVVEALELLDEA
jgi:arginase